MAQTATAITYKLYATTMLKNTLLFLKNFRKYSNVSPVPNVKEKWDVLTAVLLERGPVITRAMNDLEKAFSEYLSAVEYERSLINEVELKLEQETKVLQLTKEANDIDLVLTQTTRDVIDAAKEELLQFKAAPRITDADKKGDQRSLRRKLDKHLIFVAKQNIGNESHYLLPQTAREENESLRQCAERILNVNFGKELKTQIYGNAPCGVYKYKYPQAVQNERNVVGAKVFIYFARYLSGQVPEQKHDYMWLDRNELKKVLPGPYKNCVLSVMIDD
ncbi:large ribosomal subunit protein mL46 [Cylas formicarius]|uniref:large ribosomal subunit protein mL46 n=1 Tax=Cylas formicarius TaxID=197179 RepID=UPI002958C46A|nr:large ribosomal subunit protein mL46 [Cylas formicarius]